jgi:hypothetical protein
MSKIYFEDVEEDSKKIIIKEVNAFIQNKTFNLSDCDFLMNQLCDRISKELKKNSNNFKYILNVIFLDNSNKGFTQKFNAVFDKDTDGIISMHFPFEKISCVVNLMILSF